MDTILHPDHEHLTENLGSPGMGMITPGFQAHWLPLLVRASHQHHWDLEKEFSVKQESAFVGLDCGIRSVSVLCGTFPPVLELQLEPKTEYRSCKKPRCHVLGIQTCL